MYAWIELMFTIVPLLRAAMWGMTALHIRMTEKTFASYAFWMTSMETSIIGPAKESAARRRRYGQ